MSPLPKVAGTLYIDAKSATVERESKATEI
jgi:hypothetical protein